MLIFVALLEPCLVNTSMIHRNWGYQGSFPLPEGPGVVIKRGSGVQGGLSGRGGAALFFSWSFLRLFSGFSYTFLILFLYFSSALKEKKRKRKGKEKRRKGKEKKKKRKRKDQEKTKKRQEKPENARVWNPRPKCQLPTPHTPALALDPRLPPPAPHT